jgi:ubiquinone/menaquinone biosynthesis C-methylase UbiE
LTEPTDASQWKKEAAQVFEAESPHYETGRENSHWYQTQLDFTMQALAAHSSGRSGGRVLDLGCAAGVEIAALRAAGFTVVGADYVQLMLLSSQKRFAKDPQVGLSRADAEFLPFSSGSFDHVVCLGVLEYLQSYDRSIAEVQRVLRPGGIAVFALPSRVSLYHYSHTVEEAILAPIWRIVKRLLGKASTGTVPRHHRNTCIPGRFLTQLEQAGLHPVDHANTAFLMGPLDRFWPEGQKRLALSLERFGRTRLLGWMGSQFMVAVRKSESGS